MPDRPGQVEDWLRLNGVAMRPTTNVNERHEQWMDRLLAAAQKANVTVRLSRDEAAMATVVEILPNVKAVPAAAGGSESTQEPSPPLGTST
jgi:hypothetical protein